MDNHTPSIGRGRGRGIPVLPEGVWDDLHKPDPRLTTTNDNEIIETDSYSNTKPNLIDKSQADFESGFYSKKIQKDKKGKDWDCLSCGNVNWSWRLSCNQCKAVKPKIMKSNQEHRDGVGGGFMERQGRVATTTVEIDEDGFDDFGRRVSTSTESKTGNDGIRTTTVTTKLSVHRNKEMKALERLQQNYGHLLSSRNTASDEDDDNDDNNDNDNNNNKNEEDDEKRTKKSDMTMNNDKKNSKYNHEAILSTIIDSTKSILSQQQRSDHKDKQRHRSRSRSRDGEKSRQDRYSNNNNNSNVRSGTASRYDNDRHEDRQRDNDRYRNSDRQRESDRYRDSDRQRESDRQRDSDRYRDNDRDMNRERDRERDRGMR